MIWVDYWLNSIRKLTLLLVSQLLPVRCLLCTMKASDNPWPAQAICLSCRASLVAHHPQAFHEQVSHSLFREQYALSYLTAYQGLVKQAIRRGKFHENFCSLFLLGELAAEQFFAQLLMTLNSVHYQQLLIVPMPMNPARFDERGFNQSEIIASGFYEQLTFLVKRFNVRSAVMQPLRLISITLASQLLKRIDHTEQQAKLSKHARRRSRLNFQLNLKAIDADQSSADADTNSHVLIIDDVYTTGSTCFAAAQPFIDAGYTSIEFWTIARTIAKH